MQDKNGKTFWLDGFEGPVKRGAFFRSKIHLEIEEFQSKFKEKIVALQLTPDEETGNPSWTVEFILDATDELKKLVEYKINKETKNEIKS